MMNVVMMTIHDSCDDFMRYGRQCICCCSIPLDLGKTQFQFCFGSGCFTDSDNFGKVLHECSHVHPTALND